MKEKADLINIRNDLLSIADKFEHAEQLRFGEASAVCISVDHIAILLKMLKDDAKTIERIMGSL